MYSKSAILVALLMAAAGVTAGVSTVAIIVDNSNGNVQDKMPTFSSYSELSDFLSKTSQQWPQLSGGTTGGNAAQDQKEYASSGLDHSNTNVQVQGVDEADLVKTDGQYIYIATEDSVKIIRAYPADNMSTVASIGLQELTDEVNTTLNPERESSVSLSLTGLYVLPGKLMVLAYVYIWTDYYTGETSPSTTRRWPE